MREVYHEAARRLNMDPALVEFAFKHLCSWTRQEFIKAEAPAILWNKFGCFFIMGNKIRKYLNQNSYPVNASEYADILDMVSAYDEIRKQHGIKRKNGIKPKPDKYERKEKNSQDK